MSDEDLVAPLEATEEVVQTEVEETEAPEAVESTEGQEKTPPAEEENSEEEVSPSKARRERRKAQQAQLRQDAAEANRKLQETQARMERAKEAAQSNVQPKESDYSDYNEYLVAMGAYHAARNMDDRQSRELDEQAAAQQQEVERARAEMQRQANEDWTAQVNDAKTRHTDFEQVAFTAPISEAAAGLIKQSDMGADIAYHLGKNPEQALALNAMTPFQMAVTLGRLEATLSPPQPKTQSSAPEPINPVKPSSSPRKGLQGMSQADYRRARMKEMNNG